MAVSIRIRIMTLLAMLVFCGTACTDRKVENPEPEAAEWAQEILNRLTLEKKAAQLICADITGMHLPEDDPGFQSWLRLAGEYGIGGFVIYRGTPYTVAYLLNCLRMEAEIPILISVDFEGVAGQQVAGASEFPGNIELVGRMLKAYVKGYNEMGMSTTSKHFPGRGDRKAFPDFPGFSILDKPAESLFDNELRAFQYAIDAGVQFMMTDHLAVPAVADGSPLPASVDPKLTRGILREKLGFTCIVTTDYLWYQHVTDRFSQEKGVIKAMEEGYDLILKSRDPIAAIYAIVDAVKSGRISETQIKESLCRLLYQKALLSLHKNKFMDVNQIGSIVASFLIFTG